MLNFCLICSALLIVKVIFVITVFFIVLLCVSTIFANKDDHNKYSLLVMASLSSVSIGAVDCVVEVIREFRWVP